MDNQVRLQLFALAYNLGDFLRRLALPQTAEFVLLSSLCVSTIVNNVPVVVTGVPYGKCRVESITSRNVRVLKCDHLLLLLCCSC